MEVLEAEIRAINPSAPITRSVSHTIVRRFSLLSMSQHQMIHRLVMGWHGIGWKLVIDEWLNRTEYSRVGDLTPFLSAKSFDLQKTLARQEDFLDDRSANNNPLIIHITIINITITLSQLCNSGWYFISIEMVLMVYDVSTEVVVRMIVQLCHCV
jgi:hypothetical protein